MYFSISLFHSLTLLSSNTSLMTTQPLFLIAFIVLMLSDLFKSLKLISGTTEDVEFFIS